MLNNSYCGDQFLQNVEASILVDRSKSREGGFNEQRK